MLDPGNGKAVVGLRRFVLVRHEDVSGVSGTGLVAEGVRFTDGTVILRWLRQPAATALFASVGDLLAVHGHGGKTELRWLDDHEYLPSPPPGVGDYRNDFLLE